MEFRGQVEDGDASDVGDGAPPAAPPHRSAAANGPPADNMHAEARRRQYRYHECLRNHAASAGGHVVDGCCEFMPASPEDPLACAACGCHRSFHRRDPSPGRPLLAANARAPLLAASKHPHHHQRLPFPYGLALGSGSGTGTTTTESSSEERRGPSPSPAPAQRKRSRTTFTREQKEQMLAFAERVGWRMQRQDEAVVERFCAHAGVRRQALKVWMRNTKQSCTARRQEKLQEHPQEQQQEKLLAPL